MMHTFGRYGDAFLAIGLALCFSLPAVAQEDAKKTGKASYQECVEKGIALLKQDSLLQAESLFLQAIKAEPTLQSNSLLYNQLGQIQERLGHNQDALASYANALNLNPSYTEVLLNRASLYLRIDNQDRALQDYSAVLEGNPDHQEALFFRAYIYSGKRMYRQARADYEKLLQVNRLHEKALLGLALLNDKDNRPREAMEQINNLIAFFPDNALYYTIRGGMQQQRRNYEKAIADFNLAIELEPDNPEYLISRASCFKEMKKRKLAVEDLKRAQELGGDPAVIAEILQKK